MNWDEASEKEIQQRILQLTNGSSSMPVKYLGRSLISIPLDEYNPCQNWQDIGPLILKFGISIEHDGIDWEANTNWMGDDSVRVWNSIDKHPCKPQRAAAICATQLREPFGRGRQASLAIVSLVSRSRSANSV